MELRRRKGGDGCATAGEGQEETEDKGAGTSDAGTSAACSAAHKNSSSVSQAADAVVGAAVRGGSLLMLLALVQRASTFILNVILQRAMLSGADSSSTGQTNQTTSALEAYGAAAITLELISSTALFLSREPFRVALARSRVPLDASTSSGGTADGASRRKDEDSRKEADRQRFVNTAWLSAPVGVAFAAVVRLAYPWIIRNDAFQAVPENRQAATLVCLAAALELLCEPLALIFQHRLLVDVRVKAEAAAVLVLGVARYLLVTRARLGVLSFGYAQLLHSATLAAAYVTFATRDIARESTKPVRNATVNEPLEKPAEAEELLPERGFTRVKGWLPQRPRPSRSDERNGVAVSAWVDLGQLWLASTLAGQSILKHVLTEGDKIVLARATGLGRACDDDNNNGRSSTSAGSGTGRGCGHGGSLYEQGVYAIASGYGSLVARLLFQPLEEAARLMFSKLGAEEGTASEFEASRVPAGQEAVETMQNRESGGGGDGRRLREKMAALLATLLKLVLFAGLMFVCFGFHYTETLLRLLLAKKGGSDGGDGSFAVSEVARVLSWYCVYVLFLAANGMCEAFACAVARGRQLTGMGAGLVVSFAAFWVLVGPLTERFGTRGLVIANAAGMACRVVVSATFIRRFFLQASPKDPGIDGGRSSTDAPPISRDINISTPRRKNLWREVAAGALPHPVVLCAMAVSSAVAHASSPAATGPWSIVAAFKHILVGVLCLGLTGALFARFEQKFLRDMRSLWAARRGRPSSARDPSSGTNFDGRQKMD